MKTLYDFVYCNSRLTPDVVWYTVAVGCGRASHVACERITSLAAASTDFFFTKHTKEVVVFKSECALSLFPHDGTKRVPPLRKLRQAFVGVEWLARFLRRYPAAFLNAPIVPALPINPVALAIGEKSVTPIRKR